MALSNRLVQNIDLQGDANALKKALESIGTTLNQIVKSSGQLQKNLDSGAKAGDTAFNNQLRTVRQLIQQATILQNILDGTKARAGAKGSGLLDQQRFGKDAATISKLSRDLSSTSTAVDALDKRLANLRKRFAELREQGINPSRRDLSKEFNITTALQQARELQAQLLRLGGRALNTPLGGQSSDMQKLRSEIEKVNAELLTAAKNSRRNNFQPQIDQLRALIDQYKKLIAVEIREGEVSSGRVAAANSRASQILAMSDSQRMAQMQRAGSAFSFAPGVSSTISQKQAEDQLAIALQKRARLLDMIQKAQERGAPLRSVERLNAAYTSLNQKLGEQYKLLASINKEQAQTPGTAAFRERGARARAAINEQLFGDGGVGFATRIAGAAVITTAVFAVINAFQQATKFVVEYETALKQLQAISGATGTQTRQLADGINQVAASSKYSILEITKAATVIAQAGYSASETNMVLESAIRLSTAAGIEPTQAVDTLTGTLGAFQMQASESAHTVDVLVAALNNSKLSIDQMQAALQYAGATANETGLTFSELATISAMMANAGIRTGSTIGTGLRQLIVDLQTPTEKFKAELGDLGLTLADVDVRALGFAQVVKNLSAAGFGAEAAYASFETRAASAFLAIKGQIGTYDNMALSISKGASAAEAQATAMDSLGAQWQKLVNQLGAFASVVGQPIVDLLKGIVIAINDLLTPIVTLTTMFRDLTGSSTAATVAVRVLAGALIGALFGPIGAVVGALAGLVSGLNSSSDAMDEATTKSSEATAAYDAQMETVREVDSSIEDLIQRQAVLKTSHSELQVATENLGNKFGGLEGELQRVGNSYEDLITIMERFSIKQRQLAGEQALNIIEAKKTEITAIDSELARNTGEKYNWLGTGGSAIEIGSLAPWGAGSPQAKRNQQVLRTGLSSNNSTEVDEAWRLAMQLDRDNGGLKATIAQLEERKTLLEKKAAAEQAVSRAQKQNQDAQIMTGQVYTSNESRINSNNQRVTEGLRMNQEREGSGDAVLDAALADIERQLSYLKEGQKKFKEGTREWMALGGLINKLMELRGRVTRSRRLKEDADKKGGSKPKVTYATSGDPTADILSAQAYARTQGVESSEFGATTGHSGAGHRDKRAIDLNLPGGIVESADPASKAKFDRLAKQYQSMGYIVLWNGVRYDPDGSTSRIQRPKNPKGDWEHKRHMHVEAPVTGITVGDGSSATMDAAFEQEERDRQNLDKQKAGIATKAATSKVDAILAAARAGLISPTEARKALAGALAERKIAALNEFDVANPTQGLSQYAIESIALSRQDLEKSLDQDTTKFTSDLERSIGDFAGKRFDATMAAINAKLKEADYLAESSIRAADYVNAVANNGYNRGRLSDGDNYFFAQQKQFAEQTAARQKLAVRGRLDANGNPTGGSLLESKLALDQLKASKPDAPEDSEAYISWQQKVTAATEAYNEQLRETRDLMLQVDAATAQYIDRPLNERIRDGIGAWAAQSGVMDSAADVLAKNVVPALEEATSSLTDMFAGMLTGQKTVKQALGDMLASIGRFIIQLIAKAMALAAIKWFLKLLGIDIVDSPIGPIAQSRKKSDGGVINNVSGTTIRPKGFYNGGTPSPYISEGLTTRDSVPAMLAKGEYVIKGDSVKDIGLPMMDRINKFGSKAFDRLSNTPVIKSHARQEMNVYLIKPEERPQLGPKDIVLAITDDMLQGGQTKQLVRKIAQGG